MEVSPGSLLSNVVGEDTKPIHDDSEAFEHSDKEQIQINVWKCFIDKSFKKLPL